MVRDERSSSEILASDAPPTWCGTIIDPMAGARTGPIRRRRPAALALSVALATACTPGAPDVEQVSPVATIDPTGNVSAPTTGSAIEPMDGGVPVAGPRGVTEPIIPALPPMTSIATPEVDDTDASRVLLVGDSTMLTIRRYGALGALRGFDVTYEAASCRTLAVPSCGPEPRPTNALEVITTASGPFDVVVVMAGYDEWWTSFPSSFDAVVDAARSQGAEHIVWLTFREGVGYTAPDGSTANEAFVKNNETLRTKVASGAVPDVMLADWFAYTTPPGDWLALDGIHITEPGAFGLADYLSRIVAHLDGRPCPVPLDIGLPAGSPCPHPDTHARPADIGALYG